MKKKKGGGTFSRVQNQYKTLAQIYDQWDASKGLDYIGPMVSKLDRLFSEQSIQPQTVVDLGCGTGRLSVSLARRGTKVYAVDISSSMLRALKSKPQTKKLPILIKQQDMRKLNLPEEVDAVVSFGNAFNDLKGEDEIRKGFVAVNKNLKKGGVFIFDLYNEHGYGLLISKGTVSEAPEFTIIYEGSFDQAARCYHGKFTCFIRQGRFYLKKVDELFQYCYPDEVVKKILEESGLELFQYETFNPVPHIPLGNYRSFFACRKP